MMLQALIDNLTMQADLPLLLLFLKMKFWRKQKAKVLEISSLTAPNKSPKFSTCAKPEIFTFFVVEEKYRVKRFSHLLTCSHFLTSASKFTVEPNGRIFDIRPKNDRASPNKKTPLEPPPLILDPPELYSFPGLRGFSLQISSCSSVMWRTIRGAEERSRLREIFTMTPRNQTEQRSFAPDVIATASRRTCIAFCRDPSRWICIHVITGSLLSERRIQLRSRIDPQDECMSPHACAHHGAKNNLLC